MTFVPFSALNSAHQEQVVRASRPRVHVEPVFLHDGADLSRPAIPAIHLQVGNQHALLSMDDMKQLGDTFAEAFRVIVRGGQVAH